MKHGSVVCTTRCNGKTFFMKLKSMKLKLTLGKK